jgi:chlorobactene glucosyltransferase
MAPEGAEELLLSVCIPARNEAANIARCVAAALQTRWPNIEVIVVDDRSTDATVDAARSAGGDDGRLHVVTGVEPPPGWAGKPWACARAAGEARGDLLCFVDADVALDPDAIPALIRTLLKRRLSLVSVFGAWELIGFWEQVVIPTVGWLIRGAVDLDRVNDPGRPEAFANGQLILVERQAYSGMGGHESVRAQILEDVRLAEQFKRRGHSIGLVVAPWAFRVRLYDTLGQIFAGYSKNLYEGMGRRPVMGFGAVLFVFVAALLPFLGLFGGLYVRLSLGWGVPGDGWLLWCAVVCVMQVVFRWRLERRDGRSGAIAWAHPLSNLVLVVILLRSMFAVNVLWKGRRFIDGRADAKTR